MRLELRRVECGAVCTVGQLYVDGVFECWTLEDVVRAKGVKVYAETAIPAGTYQVEITQSPRFRRPLPLLLGVPGFMGIRIHPGNFTDDTEGCILVGRSRGRNRINDSRAAFNTLFTKLQGAQQRGEAVTIEVA